MQNKLLAKVKVFTVYDWLSSITSTPGEFSDFYFANACYLIAAKWRQNRTILVDFKHKSCCAMSHFI